jgi:hypothetical protein
MAMMMMAATMAMVAATTEGIVMESSVESETAPTGGVTRRRIRRGQHDEMTAD